MVQHLLAFQLRLETQELKWIALQHISYPTFSFHLTSIKTID